MSLTADFSLSGDALPLTDVAAATDAAVTIEEMRPNEVAPVIIARVDGDWQGFEAAVERSSDHADPAVVTEDDDGRLYRVVLGDGPGVDFEALALSKAVIEDVRVTDGGWRVRATVSDREELVAIRELCRANDLAFRLHSLARPGDASRSVLTDRQREALATAHEMGYFEVPRRASMADVADALGIAPASLSERFRRGQARLVERHVDTDLKPRTD